MTETKIEAETCSVCHGKTFISVRVKGYRSRFTLRECPACGDRDVIDMLLGSVEAA